ncbi:TIGR01459 family HAD-type hydrolase [Methylocystis parvus]|uniref:TIGR01459 family HAD-type hydrolase n=1 Tax=Methylocystis parvus TaxID=134 RepID=A0A6B8M3W8_9HYPH|nr:TIGR01459 family HAD-type hydrolase [Methylocystis parvus]QGM97086.1 TIGR01459 family HAD-type hydrolase [Methylocystis parvus]WBJ99012.1 TIGR01459 family HAD-type hydrolase [Methylocystis parvus OBBP]
MTPQPAASARDIPTISGLHELTGRYDAILCDVWGVLIDGKKHFPRAADALRRFRAQGGRVVLITNASRPDAEVRRQLLGLGLPAAAFDDLVSAGELTCREIVARNGQACYHLGPARDDGLFEEAGRRIGAPVRKVGPDEADYVVCTGLFAEREEIPQDYDARLAALKARGLVMLCANPDIVVAIGDDVVYCAGALAERYAAMGGDVLMYGKPFAPIYDAARARLAALPGGAVPDARIVAIGDGAFTDLAGAGRAGLDCVFVTDGVHVEELRPGGDGVDCAALERLALAAQARPMALAREVFW